MPDARLAGRRVLVAEDEYMLAVDLARTFEEAGAEVIGPVPSVGQAMALLGAEAAIDAAVLDVNLGSEPVYPVADALAGRGVPFLFATGHDEDAIPVRYAGVTRLEKPTEPADVVRAVGRLIGAGGP